MGYRVVGEAASGEEALRQAATHKPHLALMDIMIEGRMDGIAAANRLRQEYDIPVIFLTSHADSGTLARAREAEPYGYVVKPFADRELRASIEMALYRHQSARGTREWEGWTATALRSIGEAVVATDLRGRVKFLNEEAERLTGWTESEAQGRKVSNVFRIAPDESKPCANPVLEAIARGGPVICEPGTRVLTREGRGPFPVDASVAPIRDKRGKINGAVLTFRDCSARNRAEAERHFEEQKHLEAEKLESLERLAGGIAHDFNNLLAGICGYAALCHNSLDDRSLLNDHLQEIESISQRAAGLCQQMLAFAGKTRLNIESLNLNTFVEATALLLPLPPASGTTLKLHLASDLPPVPGDAAQLQQVIISLVTNAFEALNGQPGAICLTTGELRANRETFTAALHSPELPEGRYAFLEVADNGPGMSRDTLARIFDPFFSTKFTGRGLGLAAVLGIVRCHHGAIIVDSEPGRGSSFRLLLPVVGETDGDQLALPAREVPPQPQPQQSRSSSVLVVDDEAHVRIVLGEMLRHFGLDPVLAESGRHALALFAEARDTLDLFGRNNEKPFRLAIVDLTMPEMDGVQTADELRKLHPLMPILFISGYSAQEAGSRIIADALSNFIQKPFSPDQLKDKISSLLQ